MTGVDSSKEDPNKHRMILPVKITGEPIVTFTSSGEELKGEIVNILRYYGVPFFRNSIANTLLRVFERKEIEARLDEQGATMTTRFKSGEDGYGQIYHVVNGDELENQQDRIKCLQGALASLTKRKDES